MNKFKNLNHPYNEVALFKLHQMYAQYEEDLKKEFNRTFIKETNDYINDYTNEFDSKVKLANISTSVYHQLENNLGR